ncbi:hypothetical protein MINTM005_12850 [Mycobacterium intracellulare]|nr:hypothetical protein [Mycobacterium intracellulare]BCO56041.1 hypothetical protein MINTM005_12850 [Mycobacterium intracellulare]
MSVAVASKNDVDVIEHIKNEIDSITIDNTVDYEPKAWTREGRVD